MLFLDVLFNGFQSEARGGWTRAELHYGRIANNDARLILREKLTAGQRHDRVQNESQQLQPWTAVSTLLGLVSTV